MFRNGKSKRKEVHNLLVQSAQETPTERLNNRTAEHISTSTTNRSILKTSNLFVGPLEEIKQKKVASTSSGSSVMDQFGEKFDRYVHVQKTNAKMLSRVEQKTIETQSVIQTKNQYGNLENKSTRPRRRRFGAISRAEGVCSSPMQE